MNAIDMLKSDHRILNEILEQLSKTTERSVKERQVLLPRLTKELKKHETIKERIFYPSLHKSQKTKSLVSESYEKHSYIDRVIKELKEVPYTEQLWKAKFEVLKEYIEKHVSAEENELFPKVKHVLNIKELNDIAEKMQALKSNNLIEKL